MIPTRIFLDLDDVLNQFTMYALAHVGCNIDPTSFDNFKPEWGFDIIKADNALHPIGPQFTLTSFWSCFGRNDWANLPKSAEFDLLLDSCERLVGRDNICILTAPILDPDCAAGKIEWIYKHCPKWLHRQYLIGPCKYMCARSDALLIDDSGANVDTFREHGGQAILVPRPWNKSHGVNAIEYLKRAFTCLYFKKSYPFYPREIDTFQYHQDDLVRFIAEGHIP